LPLADQLINNKICSVTPENQKNKSQRILDFRGETKMLAIKKLQQKGTN
jgi:hypothetical protein